MNAERLHAIAKAMKDELQTTESMQLMQQIVVSLQALVQNPAQAPNEQQSVSSNREALVARSRAAPSNDWSVAWRDAVKELGVSDLLGASLADRVDEIFDRNTITQSAALEELRPVSERLNELNAALDSLLSSFRFFGIGAEELAPSQSELGYLVPRGEVHNDIGELGKEFGNIERILRPFFELAEGSRPKVEVRSISSSEFQVLLWGTPGVALLWGKAINTLLDAYQKVLQIRESRQALKEAGASEKTLGSASQDADEKMSAEIDLLVDALLDDATASLDDDRRNELKTELRTALRAMAKRLDRGYVLDVRIGELEPPPAEDEEAGDGDDEESEDDKKIRLIVEQVLEVQRRLQYNKLMGEPILQLPESIDDPDAPPPAGSDSDEAAESADDDAGELPG